MQNKINQIKIDIDNLVKSANTTRALDAVRVQFLGKAGEITALLKSLKDVTSESRPAVGKQINDLREFAESVIAAKQLELGAGELSQKLKADALDTSINKEYFGRGTIHPLNIVKNRIVNFFSNIGFFIALSPEIETDFYNFEALNVPADHPARETQDTFYITEKILLRTQTSAGQIRVMEKMQPPIKMLSPGRVFRADEIDATHSPCFSQIEGLVVDKNITMCDLKGILDAFAKEFFGEKTTTRFRPSHFPFTEPSVEVDASCSNCGGTGCRVCKGTGFIEILGAGMVNNKVLTACNINPKIYSGFAFGMGLDRVTTIMHAIPDLRAVYENDVRFLRQFK